MTLYKTKNGVKTGVVPGVGVIVDGQIESPIKLEGNFEEVVPEQTQPTAQVAAPAAPAVSPPPVQQQPQAAPNPQPVQNTNTQQGAAQ